jgi:hypothetical protein
MMALLSAFIPCGRNIQSLYASHFAINIMHGNYYIVRMAEVPFGCLLSKGPLMESTVRRLRHFFEIK